MISHLTLPNKIILEMCTWSSLTTYLSSAKCVCFQI